jgi:DNA processing protein
MAMKKYYLGFNLTPQIGPVRLRRLLERFGSPERAWHAPAMELRQAGLEPACIQHLLETRRRISLDEEMERVRRLQVRLLTWDDPAYPTHLRHIYAPPPVLYLRGSLRPDELMVAIVGTRRPTAYGRQVARQLAVGLVQAGVTVVSGLALGIDAEAHRAALEAGGRTVAVLGSGVDRISPLRNRSLGEAVIEHGALVSDYALGTAPEPRNFPPRNRIISGLSLGVIVVEAGERSGALITSDFAAEQGRDVFAVPGSILSPSSRGCHKLLRQGACLVDDVQVILEELHLDQVVEQQAAREVVPESEEEAVLLSILSTEPIHVDDLGRASALPIEVISSTLTLMELKGLVRHVGQMQYVRI